MRQPTLYAEEMWKRQRTWVLLIVAVGLALSAMTLITRKGVLDFNSEIALLYVPLGLLFGGGLILNRVRSFAEVTDAGLRVSKLRTSTLIPYDLIRQVRVQKLDLHFQDARKRYVQGFSKPLLPKDALFIRLKAEDERVTEARRRLGPQFASIDWVALPVTDPSALAWEVTSRLPERTGVNLGGQRRRKRAR